MNEIIKWISSIFLASITFLYLLIFNKSAIPAPLPILFPTYTPKPTIQNSNLKKTSNPKIDCIGPDGKHLQITYQECADFNNAWKGIKTQPTPSTSSWGVASQVDEHTWTMRINNDPKMTTPQELYDALNNYRKTHGKSALEWNDNLAKFAQSRAEDQARLGKTDEHTGFINYVNNPDNFSNIGFRVLGENSSYGYILTGVHFIEWIYAGDQPHDDNQLNSEWTDVGIGVSGTVTDLIFGHN